MDSEMDTTSKERLNGWKIVKLRDVCAYTLTGGTPSTKIREYWEGDIPWITGADIVNQRVGIIRRFITEDAVQNSSTHVVPRGNLLIVTRTGIGKLAIAPFDIAISQDITGFIPNCLIDVCYLFWALNKSQGHLKIFDQGTSINGITREDLMALRVPLPTLFEQRKIAAILSSVDAAIQETDAIIAQTEQVKRGLMQELLTRGIGHTEFRETKVGWIPVKWEAKTLGDAKIKTQYGLSKAGNSGGKYPIIRMNNLVDGRVDVSSLQYVDIDEIDYNKYRLENGDILFNRTNSADLVGKTAIFNLIGNFVFASYIIRIICKRDVLKPEFLNFYMNWDRSQNRLKLRATTGVSQSNINAVTLKKFEIPLPPIHEQEQIAAILSSVDKELEAEREHRAWLETVKTGLMQNLLTGRKRVKVGGYE